MLSIGYASCHWCRNGSRKFWRCRNCENYESIFVNIKVDREERPDLDFIFKVHFNYSIRQAEAAVTMFLDENGVPFMGGTYFPKEPKHGYLRLKKF